MIEKYFLVEEKVILKIIHISHRIMKWQRVYFDIYLEVSKYSWEIKRCEEEKCSEISYFDLDNLPNDKFVSYDLEAVKKAYNWESFSEIIFYN